MNTTATLYPADRFSWQRTLMVGRFYWPTLRMQVLIYPCISLFAGIIIALCQSNATVAMIVTGLLSMPLSLLLNFGPLVFGFKSDREIETMLPARTSEKSTFIILYNMVVMPALILFPKWAVLSLFYPDYTVSLAGSGSSEAADLVKDMLNGTEWWQYLIGYAESLFPVAVCMLCVFLISKRRILMSIIWTVAAIMLPGLIGLAFGIWMSVTQIISNSMNPQDNLPEVLIKDIMSLAWMIGTVALIVEIILCWLTARTIRRKQY